MIFSKQRNRSYYSSEGKHILVAPGTVQVAPALVGHWVTFYLFFFGLYNITGQAVLLVVVTVSAQRRENILSMSILRCIIYFRLFSEFRK